MDINNSLDECNVINDSLMRGLDGGRKNPVIVLQYMFNV